jgi:hypothetical protein
MRGGHIAHEGENSLLLQTWNVYKLSHGVYVCKPAKTVILGSEDSNLTFKGS